MEKVHLKALLVEDDPDHAEFIRQALTDADLTVFDVQQVDCLSAAEASLRASDFDIVLLDLGLPDVSGFDGLRRIRSQRPESPAVVLTSNSDPSVGVEAASHGAQDYLYKGDINARTLERVLRYAVQRQQMYLQLQRANAMLDQKNGELEAANVLLDQKNNRLAQLYETAHQFVDNVSHEFRTPLTVIKEFVTIIRDGLAGEVNDRQREFLDIANDRADDLATMVDDMLDVSKLEAGVLSVWRQQCRVSEILRHVRSAMERKAAVKKVDLEMAAGDDLPDVFCDGEKIGRVVINLVTNAIKFCGDGGRVTLEARHRADRGEVVIAVTDNGPGIAASNLKLIFNRFHQIPCSAHSSTKGFGLGLSIAKELVDLNLGEIDIESELGKGSTFSFSIPRWDPAGLANRYFRRLAASGAESIGVSLIAAGVAASVEAGLAKVVDEFLQHSFRGNDLVVPVAPHRWLVLAKCPQQEIDAMLARVRIIWAQANENRPAGRLPAITLRAKGTRQIPAGADELIELFRAEMSAATERPKSPRVLVVDDDREMLCGLGIRLSASGFEVLTAANGKTGMEAALRHRPDAILMDNYMPVMDGLEALGQLGTHEETSEIPVVMLSASLRDQQKALEQGARFFLQKPCDAETIVAALKEAIGSARERKGAGD